MCQELKIYYTQSKEHLPPLNRSTKRSTELTPKSHDEAGFYTIAPVQNDMTIV